MSSAFVLAVSMALTPSMQGVQSIVNETVVETTLTRVRLDPEAYRGVRISFPVQFASLGQVHNPFFTRFVPSDYANFYAWADEQPIWRKNEYDDVFGQLFLSKVNEQLPELYDLRVYDRLHIEGVVRNTFQGTP